MSEALVYRCEWRQDFRGVYVETRCVSAAAADTQWTWHETEQLARQAEAARMRRLADNLARQADLLVRDKRAGE